MGGANLELVSVIITTYGRSGDYLCDAIKSVINQTYSNIEIIVVDDNGLNSEYQIANKKICTQFKGIVYIANLINKGAQFSRNVGILNAKGEYIAFLDDDDLWFAEKIEYQINAFSDDQVGMVFSQGYTIVDNDFENLKLYGPSKNKEEVSFEKLLYEDIIGTTSQAIIRKECLAQVGLFDTKFPARQDYEMWIRISKEYVIKGIYFPLFYHRIHSGEQISKNHRKSIIGYRAILSKYKKDFNKSPEAKSNMYIKIARVYYGMDKIGHALYNFFKAFFSSPLYSISRIYYVKFK